MLISKLEKIQSQLTKIKELNNNYLYSVPWIQPVKIDEHIIHKDYEFIYKFRIIKYLYYFLLSLFQILSSILKIFISIFKREKITKKSANVIILSHLIDPKHISFKDDFYFGELQKNIENKKFNCKKVFLNHTSISSKKLSNQETIILPKIDCFSLEIKVFTKLISLFFFSIKNISKLIRKKVQITVVIIFILKIFSYQTQSAFRIAFQIKKILKNYSAKYLIITFEGHCYEKMIKLLNPDIQLFSYQNTPLSNSQYSLKFNNTKTLPNIIFTKNYYYKEFLDNTLEIQTKTFVLGDLTYKKHDSIQNNPQPNSILLIPEGTLSEVNVMLKFIKDNYKICSNLNFTIRFHPIYPKKLIQKAFLDFKQARNVFFSNSSIINDFKNNKYVIYRGSSLVFKAIDSGLIPLYLNFGVNVNILDIYDLDINCVNIDDNLEKIHFSDFKINKKLSDFITSYFMNHNYDILLNEIIKR